MCGNHTSGAPGGRRGSHFSSQSAQRRSLQRRLDHPPEDDLVDHAEVLEVGLDLEWQVAHQPREHAHGDVVHEQRVTIRVGLGDLVGADQPTGAARGILHDHAGTAERLAQRFGQVACHTVRRPAGCERHDESNGLVLDGIVGGLRAERDGC